MSLNCQFQGRIILIGGAPGSGKGVQGKLLQTSQGFVHISTGDLFRDGARNRTALGLEADKYIKKGQFVPDELVIKLVREKLKQPDVIAVI
jgi:adenylate kinase